MIQSQLLRNYTPVDHAFLGRVPDRDPHRYAPYMATAASAEQVHGNSVAVVRQFKRQYQSCDGLVSDTSGASLVIRTADCLPILLYDVQNNRIAAIHAGWKGLYDGIIAVAIASMGELGSSTGDILAAIGPHIRRCCYSVSPQREDRFVERGFARKKIVRKTDAASYLDLTDIAAQQLQKSGIRTSQIDILPVCTHCDKRFYSYRRDGTTSGRNYSIIILR